MNDDVESLVLLDCTVQLENALEADTDLAHFLHKEGFLKDDDYEDVINPKSLLNRKEKASILVAGIKNKVTLNSQRYHVFLKHLRLFPRKYGDIVHILDASYGRFVGRS